MRGVKRGYLAFTGAIALAACASNSPVNSTGAHPATGGSAPPAISPADNGAGANTAQTKPPRGYQLVVRDGTEYYCHYEPVAGSRTIRDEICLTKEQMAQGQKGVDDLMHQVGELPVNPQGANPGARGR
jgi:hypothetical protein